MILVIFLCCIYVDYYILFVFRMPCIGYYIVYGLPYVLFMVCLWFALCFAYVLLAVLQYRTVGRYELRDRGKTVSIINNKNKQRNRKSEKTQKSQDFTCNLQ